MYDDFHQPSSPMTQGLLGGVSHSIKSFEKEPILVVDGRHGKPQKYHSIRWNSKKKTRKVPSLG